MKNKFKFSAMVRLANVKALGKNYVKLIFFFLNRTKNNLDFLKLRFSIFK